MPEKELDDKILSLLEKNPALSAVELADVLNISEKAVQTRLEEMGDSRQTILIIDDEPDAIIAAKRALQAEGYNVIEAYNGKTGLEAIEEKIPDLILLDVMMPDMDGFEVCKHLKEDELHNHIPIIMLTAKGEVDDRVEGIETGADDYITKPFNLRELKARIQMVLRRAQS
ncbi:response regulator [Methanohalophilus halophilus]|uniref:Response regulator n=1 Tax=Methanohalophilus halophilus TaxID=2177 RepID=A0A1L3Q474_9EURY|nr:response regulator [Methanohalophilus halophilus]APH39679.1 response regulator receiver protein [Methanohalophilus halophilus]RNI08987.1 response regulator [Methanohalophilus halophilus]SDW35522.1 two-component system, OmpR family, alkaline phosphatase synthesis response regulator PhoP [Methanohalophilus halophilus]